MTDPHGGRTSEDGPDYFEPQPQPRAFPPPAPPSQQGYPLAPGEVASYEPVPAWPQIDGPPPVSYQPYGPVPPGVYQPWGPVPSGIQPYPVRPYPMPVYGPPPQPPAQPTRPSRYSQLLRGPRYRWWKPLLTMALTLALYLGFSLLTLIPPLVAGLVIGVPNLGTYILDTLTSLDDLSPVGFVALNLSLIALIPTAMLSIWIVHGVRPRFLTSVTGGIRWRWMLRCLLVVVPVWLVYLGGSLLFGLPTGGRPEHWVVLLLLVVVLTPFQAAGEEYFFRGWMMQNIGAWFARPLVGLVVVTVISTITFSAAHGSFDLWVLGSIGCLAVAGCLATWRTGGLEAAIAMHAVNNLLVFFVTIVLGGWQEAFVGSDTRGTVLEFLLSAAVHGVALALIWWQAGRVGLSYLSIPSWWPEPAPPTGPAQPQPWQQPAIQAHPTS